MDQTIQTDFYFHKSGNLVMENGEYLYDIPAGIYKPIEVYGDGKYRFNQGLRPFDYNKPFYNGLGVPVGLPVHSYFPIEKWNSGLQKADRIIHHFLNGADFYKNNGLDYRRSILMYGDPGTGKSQYINHITEKLVEEKSAIVIRLETYKQISILMDRAGDTLGGMSGRLKVFVIEEVAALIRAGFTQEVMHFLDSHKIRENVLVLLSSNFPEEIPENVIDRPGRIDTLCQVAVKDYGDEFIKNWYSFVTGKTLSADELRSEWLHEVKNRLSPAYLKELFVAAQIHEMPIGQMWEIIKRRRELIKSQFSKECDDIKMDRPMGFELSIMDMEELGRILEED